MRGTNESQGRKNGLRGAWGNTRRWSALGVGGGAMMIAITMMLSPVAAAHTPVTYTAPYLHAVTSNSLYSSVSGCAKLAQTKLHFSTLTGMGTWAGKATAKTCPHHLGPIGGYGSSFAEAQTLVGVPIHSFHGAATPTTVAVTWTMTFSAAVAATHTGSCPAVVLSSTGYGYSYCAAEAFTEMFGYSYLIDLTNGSYFYSSNYPTLIDLYNYSYNDTYCYSFTCYSYNYTASSASSSMSGSTSATWWINGTLNHADKYAVETYVYAYVDSYASGFPAGSASSVLDLASSGNGEALSSIVVS
jgi:hypothetical protein